MLYRFIESLEVLKLIKYQPYTLTKFLSILLLQMKIKLTVVKEITLVLWYQGAPNFSNF